jgi:hypothetical protein
MKRIYTLSLLLLLPGWALCCSCSSYASFCEIITPQSEVAAVRIINTIREGHRLWIDVVVEESLQGTIAHDTMTVLASSGTSCDPSYEFFNVGDQLIVHRREAIVDGPTSWFAFAFENPCAEDFLRIDNGQVVFYFDGQWRSEPYDFFKTDIGGCARQERSPRKAILERLLSIYPQPAATAAVIDLQIALNYELALFTAAGQLLLEQSVVNEARHQLDVSRLPHGVYVLRLRFRQAEVVRKLVVQR